MYISVPTNGVAVLLSVEYGASWMRTAMVYPGSAVAQARMRNGVEQ
jgi:hypothetical protein